MGSTRRQGICDRKSKRYLGQIADAIGYYEFIEGCEPTRKKLNDRDIKAELHQTVQTPNGAVTVYWALEAPNADGLTATAKQEKDIAESDGVDQDDVDKKKSIRYPADIEYKSDGGGYLHRTFVFKHTPDEEEIEAANKIHKLRLDMCSSEVDIGSVFNCSECGKRTHLANIVVEPPTRKKVLQFKRRVKYHRESVCSKSCFEEAMASDSEEESEEPLFEQTEEDFNAPFMNTDGGTHPEGSVK